MKYNPIHKRVMRGTRFQEITEERSAKARLKKNSIESTINRDDQMTNTDVELLLRCVQVRNRTQAKLFKLFDFD